MSLAPFFSYYGSKWRAESRYPSPMYRQIVEPFAGSAGYALHYPHRDVLLVDKNPVVAGVWSYLIATPADEIRRIPLLEPDETVNDKLAAWPQEARWLVGFWCNVATSAPGNRLSRYAREEHPSRGDKLPGWSGWVRERIAAQVDTIRHWRVVCGDYTEAEIGPATYFVDPPYSTPAGRRYPVNAIDFTALGAWCRRLEGQVIVCEQMGAEWLPFESIGEVQTTASLNRDGSSSEVFWTNGGQRSLFGTDPYRVGIRVLETVEPTPIEPLQDEAIADRKRE